ncbi:MAG: hypothetical protein V1747_11160 [Candidatus Omnitrophota bacterium]
MLFSSTFLSDIECTPAPGGPNPNHADNIADTVAYFIAACTTEELGLNAKVGFHNSFYLMDIYLEDSTYQNYWTPGIVGTDVVDLSLHREKMGDEDKVVKANDSISQK